MKKRIGNDISFVWHIYRKDGDTQVPESFTGKEVEVKLISPLQRPVTIEDITIATGVVTFTFRGKHQVTLGNYVAVLQENTGEDGMVTLDVVSAVTLVPHSYMEEDGDEGDVIEAEAVELTSEITAGGGGGIEQQQADWAQTDDTAVDFIKNKPDLDVYCRKDADNAHSDGVSDTFAKLVYDERNPSVLIQADRLTVGGDSIKFYHSHRGEETKELSLQLDDVEKIKRTATTELDGLMSAADKGKLNDLPTATELAQELAGKQDTINDLAAIRSGAQAGATAYQMPATGIPATDLASDVQSDIAAIDGIEAVIPEQASATNKLADKDFVNSSIATATATYRGSYNLVADLSLTISATHAQIATALATAIQTADNNDYCYVQIPVADATPTEIASVERYKHNGTVWEYEYTLNNSGFTAAQWAAINSGITSGLVAKLSALPTNSELTASLNGKADVGRVEDIEDALSVVESETADATDYTTETTSVSTDNITINPVAVRRSTIYSVYKQGGGQESIEGVFSPGYTSGSYILNVQIAQAGTVKIDSIRTRYYSGYYPIVYFYFTPTGGEKVKVAEIAKASSGTPIGYKYEEPTVSINAPGAGVLSIELWLYDIDTYNTIPAFFWMEHERSSVVYYAITSISFEQSSLTGFVNDGSYNSTTKKIELKHDSDILAEIDATDIFDSDNYYDKNDVDGLLAGKANTADLAKVATSGSYNDLSDKPTIPAAQVQSDWNEGDMTSKAYIKNKPTIPTVPTNVSAFNNDAGYITASDVADKQDKMLIVQVASGTTAINAAVNTYYEVAGEVGTLSILLPEPTDSTKVSMVVIHLTAGTTPSIVIGSTETIDYSAAYDISASKEYEINCLFNGDKWVVADMEVV